MLNTEKKKIIGSSKFYKFLKTSNRLKAIVFFTLNNTEYNQNTEDLIDKGNGK